MEERVKVGLIERERQQRCCEGEHEVSQQREKILMIFVLFLHYLSVKGKSIANFVYVILE